MPRPQTPSSRRTLRHPTRKGEPALHTRIELIGQQLAELRWLEENRWDYAGQWIALQGGELLAHSHDFNEVLAVVRNLRPAPLVTRLESFDPIPFAGW